MELNKRQTEKFDNVSKYLRSPSNVMRLERLGSFHQCRLSFIRHLLRKLQHYKWRLHG